TPSKSITTSKTTDNESTTTRKTTKQSKTSTTSTTLDINYVFPVDINTVSLDQLTSINGIGGVTAQKIIDYRKQIGVIYNMDLLLNIDGIGQSTLALLKQYLYVSDEDARTTPVTTTVKTTKPSHTITTTAPKTTKPVTTTHQELKPVNINTATANEISDCLLVDIELAEKIIDLRNQIQYFSNSLELLYIDGFTEKMHAELKDYIIV
ncbi:MAG: helix-hairpin-helix domain-containing protein, partial [Ruminococcus sp.]|nr:helix-hairpin-helix domain-containing protein [Ruminococcus sp.]